MHADRLAERLGLGEVWVKNETANPTHSFKDRVVSVALARAQELGFETIACASTGNLANAVAAHAAAAGLPAYVLIPADLEEAEDPRHRRLRRERGRRQGQLRRRQPALHRAGRRPRRLGVRQHQHAALLRRGLQDARPSRSPSSSAGSCPTASSRRSPPARCSRRSRAAFEEWIDCGLLEGELPTMNGAQAEGCSPVAQAFAAGTPSAARSSPTRSPSRWRSATPPTARTRSSSPDDGRRRRLGDRRRDPRRHPPAGRDDRHLHRDRRRRHHRDARQARRARRHRPRRARRALHHRRRAEDDRRGPRDVRGRPRSSRRVEAFDAPFAVGAVA